MQRRRIHFHLSLLALTLIFAVALGLSSCGGGVKFNLNFVVDGEVYSTVSTNGNEAIELPANPTKEGYTFDGWYWDNGTWQKPFTANSLINAPLSADMSVYAKFNYNDFLTPNLQGTDISSNEMSVLNDRISYVVSNTTEMFSFLNDITVANEASYTVARDLACQDVIVSKTASLEYGDNVFYIFVTNGNDAKLYTVTIRRLPVYTVSFNTEGGTDVATQRIEEGSFAIVPTTDRAGYTFISWSYDLATPITDNITVTANWQANDNTKYKVEYYLENLHDSGYTLFESETDNLIGTTDTIASAEKKVFEHFSLNISKSKLNGNISGDGKLVLRVYYSRNTYTLSNANKDYGSISATGSYAYGTESIEVAVLETNLGCEFTGWYSENKLISSSHSYTFTVDKNVEARFAPKSEMSNFKFTSTATTCSITGIKDKTVTEIVVPDYVTSIGSSAFVYCTSLTSVTIGNSVTSIGYEAFYGCTSLTSVYITDIASWCGIYFASGSSNPLCYAEKLYLNGESINNLIIPDSVTTIGSSAFYDCDSLTSVTIPDSVTTIGSSAFYNCDSLTSVTIGDSVTTIGSSAFYNCPIEYAKMPAYAISSISKSKIKTIVITSGSIGDRAFYDCDSLTSVTIGDSVTSIGYEAFYYCYKLVEVINHSSLDITAGGSSYGYVGSYAKEVHKGESKIVNVGDYLFYTYDGVNYLLGYVGTSTNLILPENYNGENYEIYKYAFRNCTNLTSVTIGDSVTSIGNYAFRNCTNLTSVTIGDSVTSIGDRAFYNCDSLTSVTIGDSVTSIGSSAFYDCDSLTSVTIGDSVTTIGSSAFYNCPIEYAKMPSYAISSISKSNIKTIVITSGSIGSSAFAWCDSLTSVTIGDSVTSIGDRAFYNCDSLTSVYITDIASWCGIYFASGSSNPLCYAEKLYLNGESINNLIIPDSVTTIGEYAFYGCDSLTGVTIPDSVTSIGSYAFAWCDSLTSVTIGDSVTSIGDYAFRNCTSLTSIKYRGTSSQWNAIVKVSSWNSGTGSYKITYNYTGE